MAKSRFSKPFTQQEPIAESTIARVGDILRSGRLHRYNTLDGEISEAFFEGATMLNTQVRRGHEDGDLLVGTNRLKRRSHGQLGFAIADIAAKQAIHRSLRGHVILDLGDRGDLVGSLLIGKRLLELPLPDGIVAKIKAANLLPFSLGIQQCGGHFFDTFGDIFFLFFPFFGADLAERRSLGRRTYEFLDEADISNRHMDLDLVGVFERDVLGLRAGLFHHLDADEFANAVADVDNEIALFEIEHTIDRRDALDPPIRR